MYTFLSYARLISKALYNSDMKATKQEIQEIQAIKTCLKDPTKANTKQKIK